MTVLDEHGTHERFSVDQLTLAPPPVQDRNPTSSATADAEQTTAADATAEPSVLPHPTRGLADLPTILAADPTSHPLPLVRTRTHTPTGHHTHTSVPPIKEGKWHLFFSPLLRKSGPEFLEKLPVSSGVVSPSSRMEARSAEPLHSWIWQAVL
eukprot:TRINITY_DN24531_c0_g2_i1.p1 TRINITY_DN24531_c0_g2~~TRINITY_DN24531_c0_g2_i1.p1  ORF type:complete len:153 (-),score=7.13 TRINITY_DN24531_c0_g2_i1:182-640(-)